MMRLIMMLMIGAGLCLAADVTGKWSGTLSLGNSEMPGYMVLTQKGAVVTGTAGGGPQMQHPIERGAVEVDQITIEARPGPVTIPAAWSSRARSSPRSTR